MTRKFYIFLGVIVVACLLLLVYILVSRQNFTFKELKTLDNVKQVEIFLSLEKDGSHSWNGDTIVINNPDQISKIVALTRTFADNWQYTGFDPSSPQLLAPVGIIFFDSNEQKIALGVGYTGDNLFYIRQYLGPGRYLNEHEFKELMNAIGIDEKFAYFER